MARKVQVSTSIQIVYSLRGKDCPARLARDAAVVLCVQLFHCKAMIGNTRHHALHRHLSLLLLLTCLLPASLLSARSIEQDNPDLRLELLFEGLGVPWGMTFVSPQQMLVTERQGRPALVQQSSTPAARHGLANLPWPGASNASAVRGISSVSAASQLPRRER